MQVFEHAQVAMPRSAKQPVVWVLPFLRRVGFVVQRKRLHDLMRALAPPREDLAAEFDLLTVLVLLADQALSFGDRLLTGLHINFTARLHVSLFHGTRRRWFAREPRIHDHGCGQRWSPRKCHVRCDEARL